MTLVVGWEESRKEENPDPGAALLYCFMVYKGKIIAGVYYLFKLCPTGTEVCFSSEDPSQRASSGRGAVWEGAVTVHSDAFANVFPEILHKTSSV